MLLEKLHRLLARQIKKHSKSEEFLRENEEFLSSVSEAYLQADQDRSMVERSLALTSEELLAKNFDLSTSVSLLNATLEAATDGVLVVDTEGRITLFNQSLLNLWEPPAELMAKRVWPELRTWMAEHCENPDHFTKIEDRAERKIDRDIITLKNGKIFERFAGPQTQHGEVLGTLYMFRDVTEQLHARDELIHAAFHDPLTGLPNRALFMNSLDRLITLSRPGSPLFAVLFLDLDRFKVVNDGLGHMAGDLLLVAMAKRLRSLIPEHCLVARLGGDEFTVLAENVQSEEQVLALCERILAELRAPVLLETHEVFTTVSIGVTFSTNSYNTPEEMLRDADTAMYQAKRKGKSRYQVFSSYMRELAVSLVRTEADLRRAIQKGEFELRYQPIVDAAELRVRGFEALIRWRHPQRGIINPGEFIELAEETGLILPLGEWVLREACSRIASLNSAGRDYYASVNLSGWQISQQNFLDTTLGVIRDTGIQPHLLNLELTETVLMDSDERTLQSLSSLRELGVNLSLDDFGTGYSSLSYLKGFPVNHLKIDRSFIKEIPEERDMREITRAILSMAAILDLRVVAEGVEKLTQIEFLAKEGCHLIQGFYFARPLEESAILSSVSAIESRA